MQPRERLLATLLAATAAVTIAYYALLPMVTGPLQDRDATIKSTETIVRGLEDKELQLLSAMRTLSRFRNESLPPNPFDAQREYSEWLMDLALLCNWRDPKIQLGSRTPRGAATMVPITIKGQATLEDVNRLLQRLESAALLQRVVDLELESPAFDGNPLLDVELIAEGVAMQDANPRTRLFPTAVLTGDVGDAATTLSVKNPEGFPKTAPFVVRLDHELIEVQSIDGNGWTVARGALGTAAAAHADGTPVELLPQRTVTAADSRQLPSVQRLFVRAPDIGAPQVAAELTPAVRGRTWSATLTVPNWDPQKGTPRFELSPGAPSGMSLDAQSGVLQWTPPDDFALGSLEIPVAVFGSDARAPEVETRLTVEVRRPNQPPRLEMPESVPVWLGRPWEYLPPAVDPDLPNDTLTWEIGGDVPEGLTIDAATGRLAWIPDDELDLGEFEVEISVTDGGQPPESDRRTLTLKLADDNALYTYFSGAVAFNGVWEAWLYDRSTGRNTVVRVGEEFQIADVSARVVRIGEDVLDVQSGEQVYQLKLGQNLRAWTPAATAENSASGDGATGSGKSPDA